MTKFRYQAVGQGIGVQGEVNGGMTQNTFHIVVGVPPPQTIPTAQQPPSGPFEAWLEALIALGRAAFLSTRHFLPPHVTIGDDDTWE
ncbi:hypothetical protein [Streptomyces sp. ISL-86]|uniref:hypothetical protein n=1 Tax=Streptomyces sp. ISL-86 TaxID=2819187 RepID=UPI001BE8BF25|nr:hypothetical protein [Streptomyces sp. ISL-86]MBT2458209.1 hypothetical protein [Streptomyces sp. ISL-86]